MIRRYYALPQEELGCQAVELLHFHMTPDGLSVETQPGTATVTGGTSATVGDETLTLGAEITDGTFSRKPEVRQPKGSGKVENIDRFLDWFANTYTKNSEDSHAQQLVSGALEYLWLQRADLLPAYDP